MACGYINADGTLTLEDTTETIVVSPVSETSPCGAAILNLTATLGEGKKQESPVLHGGTLAGAN